MYKEQSMSHSVPQKYKLGAVYAGIKSDASKLDVTLITSDVPAVAAGVYTTNLMFGAHVALDKMRTPGDGFRAVAINSGNSNSCTGDRGLADAITMAAAAAKTCGAAPEQALVMSTGIIGEFMPIEKVLGGIAAVADQLGTDEAALRAANGGMMTTDSVHKLSSRQVVIGGRTIQITGMAKGAAMIGPNMATMLGLILTDARLSPSAAQEALSYCVQDSFNCISVDGHMSTCDTVLLLANGGAGGELLAGKDFETFRAALYAVCGELARSIPADGEGTTHLVTIDVRGCASTADAHKIAKTVAESPLVKTAIAGADPNWGRIVSAAGYAQVAFNPAKVDLRVNGFELYRQGSPVPFDAEQVSASIHDNRDTHIELTFCEGNSSRRFWTTDLTAEYVRLNADYHT